MNGRKYIMQQKLKKDKQKFQKKLYLSNHINFFNDQIKTLTSKISQINSKKNIAITHSENSEDILKRYIAELNMRIFPNSFKKNYGNENIKINLSNLRYLTNFQNYKKDLLNIDKRNLEDNAKDLIYYMEEHRKEKIKKQVQLDIDTFIFYKEKRQEIEEMKKIIPDLLKKVEMLENIRRENKFLYEQIIKQNKILELILQNRKNLNNQLKAEEKNNNKNEKLEEKNKILVLSNKGYILRKKVFENMRSLSEKNFLSNYKSENYYEEIFEDDDKNEIRTVHSLLFERPKFTGYKSPMSFLKYNKIKMKKLVYNEKSINPYDYLNIFTNNKRYDTINEFIENFNTINNKKISFHNLNTEKTTANTISSNFSSKKFHEKKKKKIRLYSSQALKKENQNEIILFRDYLYDLIDQQQKIIKDLNNKKTDEIRCKTQIKSFLTNCIEDLNIEIFEYKEKFKTDKKIKDISKQNEKLLYILTYIFDNCFSGIKDNIKKLINNTRNNISINIENHHSFHNKNEENKKIIKKNFSFIDKKIKKS